MTAAALVGYALVVVFYIGVPIFIAFRQRHPSRWLIAALSVLTSWTLIGWIIAVFWARNTPGTRTSS